MKALLKGARWDWVAKKSYAMLYKNIVPKMASKGTKKIILSAEAEVKPITMIEKHPFSWRYIRSRGKKPKRSLSSKDSKDYVSGAFWGTSSAP